MFDKNLFMSVENYQQVIRIMFYINILYIWFFFFRNQAKLSSIRICFSLLFFFFFFFSFQILLSFKFPFM